MNTALLISGVVLVLVQLCFLFVALLILASQATTVEPTVEPESDWTTASWPPWTE